MDTIEILMDNFPFFVVVASLMIIGRAYWLPRIMSAYKDAVPKNGRHKLSVILSLSDGTCVVVIVLLFMYWLHHTPMDSTGDKIIAIGGAIVCCLTAQPFVRTFSHGASFLRLTDNTLVYNMSFGHSEKDTTLYFTDIESITKTHKEYCLMLKSGTTKKLKIRALKYLIGHEKIFLFLESFGSYKK